MKLPSIRQFVFLCRNVLHQQLQIVASNKKGWIEKCEKIRNFIEENKTITYQFRYPQSPLNSDEKDKRKIKFKPDNDSVSIFFSERYPFPNKYINDNYDEDKEKEEYSELY